jgi:hypothetical protein
MHTESTELALGSSRVRLSVASLQKNTVIRIGSGFVGTCVWAKDGKTVIEKSVWDMNLLLNPG